jgi:hypothetical protein
MVKVNADAIRRNANRRNVDMPVWVVVNGANAEQCHFVHGVRMRAAESVTSINKAMPDGFGRGIAYLITSDDIDVQTEQDGEFRNLNTLLEEGTLKWSTWAGEYDRLGIHGC